MLITASGMVCPVTSTPVTMTPNWTNTTYAWNISSETTPQSLTIGFICGGSGTGHVPNGFAFTVKDENGMAGTFPISITPDGSDTIDAPGGPAGVSFVLNANFESITFQCDSSGNWLVE